MSKKEKQKAKGTFTVLNEKGLHTRPSTELVKCASTFRAQISLTYQDLTVNAKSLLGTLMLAATKGSKILIEADGTDAQEAISAICELSEIKFKIHY